MNKDEIIIKDVFNYLLIPQTDIAIVKGNGAIYTPENIEAACNRFKIMVEDKLRAKGYSKEEKNELVEKKNYVPTLKKEVMKPSVNVKNRGFADIIILAIIVLVYAAIIINLILKLK